MNQALIDELTQFALIKTDELRIQRLNMVGELGREEAVFQLCWRTYQWPTGTPEGALKEFARRVSFEHLLDVERRGGITAVGEVVVGVARSIPKFFPHQGFKVFKNFFVELVKIAKNNGGSLVKAFNKFTDVKQLELMLRNLPGLGPVLAPGLVREFRLADIIKLDINKVSLSPADPVLRVLRRTRLIPEDASIEEAENIIRKTFRIPPMMLDAGIWHIGFYYCREKPECGICPISHTCPKCFR